MTQLCRSESATCATVPGLQVWSQQGERGCGSCPVRPQTHRAVASCLRRLTVGFADGADGSGLWEKRRLRLSLTPRRCGRARFGSLEVTGVGPWLVLLVNLICYS